MRKAHNIIHVSVLLVALFIFTACKIVSREELYKEGIGLPEVAALISQAEPHARYDWAEYRRGDWHVAVAWVQDPERAEARVYAYRRDIAGQWILKSRDVLPYAKDKLDHVIICYPDPFVMLINSEGILIRSISVEETLKREK